MPLAAIVAGVLAMWATLLGQRLFNVLGLVVHCAMFWFPLGLTGLVVAGVTLLFLLRPQRSLD